MKTPIITPKTILWIIRVLCLATVVSWLIWLVTVPIFDTSGFGGFLVARAFPGVAIAILVWGLTERRFARRSRSLHEKWPTHRGRNNSGPSRAVFLAAAGFVLIGLVTMGPLLAELWF